MMTLRKVLMIAFTAATLAACASPALAEGGKHHGDKGKGAVHRIGADGTQAGDRLRDRERLRDGSCGEDGRSMTKDRIQQRLQDGSCRDG